MLKCKYNVLILYKQINNTMGENKEKLIVARTTKKCKETFEQTAKEHGKTPSYLINLLMDAYNKAPLKTLVNLEHNKTFGNDV